MSTRPFAPTSQQREAIDAPAGPVRVIAGAGSGKTAVMAARVGALIASGIAPEQILGLTFSNKAAENLRRRVAAAVGGGIDTWITTYHGFGASIVRTHALTLGFDQEPRLIDRARAFQLLYAALDEVELQKRKIGRVAHLASAALRLASQCADHLTSLADVESDCRRIIHDDRYHPNVRDAARGRLDLLALISIYERAKRTHAMIDFGDQIALAVRALTLDPAGALALREAHPFVLLDEYQDTNFAQRRLLQLIYPPGSPVTAVGDDMQAIYAFRGSHLRNILDFEDHFATRAAPPQPLDSASLADIKLTTNFRSGPRIVALANTVHATVATATEKELTADTNADPDVIEAMLCSDERSEATHLAAWVLERGAPWSATAILGRKRKIFPEIARALQTLGIPVEVVGTGGLLTRPEIIDLHAWLEILALDDPDVATLRLLRSPLRAVSMRDLAVLARHAGALARSRQPSVAHPPARILDSIDDVDAVVGLSAEAWARVKHLCADRAWLQQRCTDSTLPALFECVIELERLRDRVDEAGAENLARFIDLARRFDSLQVGEARDHTGPAHVRAFLDYLQLLVDGEDDPPEAVPGGADVVRVMTIHQAKGLEFDNVALAGLAGQNRTTSIFPDERLAENGATQAEVLPLWLREDNDGLADAPRTKTDLDNHRAHANDQRADEERRLLYVAITRARSRLLCSAAHWYGGPASPQGPSAFYDHIVAQSDIVYERFREPPAKESPQVTGRRLLAAAPVAASPSPAPSSLNPAPTPIRSQKRPRHNGGGTRHQPSLLLGDVGADLHQSTASPAGNHTVRATALAQLAHCPRSYEWETLLGVPQARVTSGAAGTRIHRLMELSARGLVGPEDHELTTITHALQNTPFAGRLPSRVEIPIEIVLGAAPTALTVTGRVDARFDLTDDTGYRIVHLVDWKTGPAPVDPEPDDVQLAVYALAAVESWGIDPDRLLTSYVHLRSDRAVVHTTRWNTGRLTEARARLDALASVALHGPYAAKATARCGICSFATVCLAGRTVLG